MTKLLVDTVDGISTVFHGIDNGRAVVSTHQDVEPIIERNKALAKEGLKRMFLHACRTIVAHPQTGAPLTLDAPLPPELQRFVAQLDSGHAAAL